MRIDVIIPVYKPDEKLYKSVAMLARQTIAPHEIILLNTVERENDTTESLKEKLGAMRIEKTVNPSINIRIISVDKEDFDHGGTRNYGASLSKADYMLFMTQDAIPKDIYLLEKLADALEEDDIALAYAKQTAHKGASYKERISREFNYPDISCTKSYEDINTFGIKTFFASNVCAMYKRSIYNSLGGFVKHTIFNEDMIFAYNVINSGYKIAYAAEAEIYHSHNYNIAEQFTRSFDNGVSHNQYSEIFNSVKVSNEGMRFLSYLIERAREDNKQYMIIEYIVDCAARYTGFLLGKHYDMLPESLIRKCSMNKKYWQN